MNDLVETMAVYNKEDFLRHADQLMPEGFERNEEESIYEKVEQGRTLRLVVLSNDFFPHSATFTGISAEIIINEVEDIYQMILVENPLSGQNIDNTYSTIDGNFTEVEGVNYDFLYSNQVENDATFNVIKPMHDLLISEALEFFDRFPTLQSIYDHAESLELKDQAKFISQPLPYRYMIIKKLVGAIDYEDYAVDVINYYRDENQIQDYQFAESLHAKLMSL